MTDDFVSLHTHTDHSLLDGLQSVDDLLLTVKALEQPGVATTDHGTLSAAYGLVQGGQKYGLKAVVGEEFYVAPRSKQEKTPIYFGSPEQRKVDVSKGAYTHLTVLARNDEGLRNLYRLHNSSWTDGFYQKQRTDLDDILELKSGLIVLSGCLGGEFQTRLKLGQVDEAYFYAETMKRELGENFFIEIMHHGFPLEDEINPQIIDIANTLSIPLVATNDAHYSTAAERPAHDAFLALQTGKTLATRTFQFEGEGYFLRTRGEMEALPLPTVSLDNTLVVMDMVTGYETGFSHRVMMPSADVPPWTTEEDELRRLCDEWLTDVGDNYNGPAWERIQFELNTIIPAGYAGYFLILKKIIDRAKSESIRLGPGRGSACGCLVAFALGITRVNPLSHGLLFERFLNPSRVSLPDIDTDIASAGRDRFLDIVMEEFGIDYTAVIGTRGTIGALTAIQDATRVLGFPRALADEVKTWVPPMQQGRKVPLKDTVVPDDASEDALAVLELAAKLEDKMRNVGQHAAGLVISPVPLDDVIPTRRVMVKKKGDNESTKWKGRVSSFDDTDLEALGLVKYDFLGIANLDTIAGVCDAVGIDWDSLPTEPEALLDPATLALLGRGETLGVFQLDSPGMRRLLQGIRPKSFDDVAAVLALYRPGPMGAGAHTEFAKRAGGPGSFDPLHPELDFPGFMDQTRGLLVYQEQVLMLLNEVCGWDYGEADNLFYAMRKKKRDVLASEKPHFYEAAEAKGVSREAVDALWDTLIPFADYSFNKSHSVGYGLVSYWMAYLKAHHPIEFVAAILAGAADKPDKLQEYLAEAVRMDIPILSPDVNDSVVGFTPTSKGLRYGLEAIRGVGPGAFEALVKGRPYRSLDDFFQRADAVVLNKRVMDALVKSGAMDSLCYARHDLLLDHERLAGVATRSRLSGGDSLFAPNYTPVPRGSYDAREYAAWEQESLGLVLTKPVVQLSVNSPLSLPQWQFVHRVLQGGADEKFVVHYHGQVVAEGVTTLDDQTKSVLADMGVEVS